MSSDLREVVHGEFKLLREERTKHGFKITKVVHHMRICFDSLESIIPFAMVADEIAQLRNKVNHTLDWSNALSAKLIFGSPESGSD